MTEHKVAVCYRFNLWQTAAFPYFTEPFPAGILKKNDHTQGGHIMDYSIIGFPRIGIHRELKFATEAYFRSEIDADELKRVVSQQRMEQWTRQRDAGAGFIPSNDFSLYDGMLDTAYMLNAIPRRYADLRLSDIDTYFAMARGYQGAQGDVKAFTMKKWFNTNYHYMVPELDDDMELKLRSDAFLDGFHQARSLGIQTKPVVAGPFTFLKLARCTGNKSATDFVDDILFAYADILKRCGENGVEWLQVDEPYLVMDLTMGDVALFRKLYQTLLEQKGTVKVLLQTYFGDVRDCYRQLCELPFDGIGLDFVEGKQTAALVAANGFPKDKILFAGLVNGKNIWRTNYKDVLERIAGLKSCCDHIVLSTSCSLLHVPYTVKNEPQLSTEIIRHFSFAYEKLDELRSRNLYNMVIKGMKNTRTPRQQTMEIPEDKIKEASIIDIQLKDLKGNTRSLTDLKGKVVLIDFTVYNNAMSAAHNLALRELYNKYASQGFEIYQISLDGDEHFWKTSADNLPWVCVRDANGAYSSYISLYNVTNLPSVFLVNRNNELSARGENIKDLDEAIKKLL